MQALRNLKFKNYPFWRLDKINQQIIEGGWHFSYMQSPSQILNKLSHFLMENIIMNILMRKISKKNI